MSNIGRSHGLVALQVVTTRPSKKWEWLGLLVNLQWYDSDLVKNSVTGWFLPIGLMARRFLFRLLTGEKKLANNSSAGGETCFFYCVRCNLYVFF